MKIVTKFFLELLVFVALLFSLVIAFPYYVFVVLIETQDRLEVVKEKRLR